MLSKAGEIRRDEACLDYSGNDVVLYPCHGSKGNQVSLCSPLEITLEIIRKSLNIVASVFFPLSFHLFSFGHTIQAQSKFDMDLPRNVWQLSNQKTKL